MGHVMAYLAEWKRNMTQGLQALDSRHGYFNPACFIHCGFTSMEGPFIHNKRNESLSYMDAFIRWYDGHGPVRLEDNAPLLGGNCSLGGAGAGSDLSHLVASVGSGGLETNLF